MLGMPKGQAQHAPDGWHVQMVDAGDTLDRPPKAVGFGSMAIREGTQSLGGRMEAVKVTLGLGWMGWQGCL